MVGVGKRMRLAMETRGFSADAVARRLSVNRKTFSNYLADISEPKFEVLLRFCELVGVEVGSLLTLHENVPLNYSSDLDKDEFTIIKMMTSWDEGSPISAEGSPQLAFSHEWLNREGIDPAYVALVGVEDEQMEPTLPCGGVVLIDLRDVIPISKGRMFAVRMGDAIRVRRVERNVLKTTDVTLIHRDDPDAPTEVIDMRTKPDFEVLGRVVWSSQAWPS